MKEKLSLLTELIKLAKVDKKNKDEEYQFLSAISNQLGIPKLEFDKLFNIYIEFSPPKLEFDRILQFQRLILLMNIDREIHEKEISFIKNLGIRMGLNPGATDEVLEKMYNYPNNLIPPGIMIEIFKKYHN